MSGCLVCLIRKKKCNGPGLVEGCGHCRRLNIQCLRHAGRGIPQQFQDEKFRSIIKRHTRRLSNRRGRPLCLLDFIAIGSPMNAASAIADDDMPPLPSHNGAPNTSYVDTRLANDPDTHPVTTSNVSLGVYLAFHLHFSSNLAGSPPAVVSNYGGIQGVPEQNWAPEHPPHSNTLPSENSGIPQMPLPLIPFDGGSSPTTSLPVSDDVEHTILNWIGPLGPTASMLGPQQPPVPQDGILPALLQSQHLLPVHSHNPDNIGSDFLDESLSSYPYGGFSHLSPLGPTGGHPRHPGTTHNDEHTTYQGNVADTPYAGGLLDLFSTGLPDVLAAPAENPRAVSDDPWCPMYQLPQTPDNPGSASFFSSLLASTSIRGTHSSFDTDQSYDYSTEVVAPILLATPQQPELEAFTAHLPLPLSSPDPADSPGGQAEPPYRNHHTFDAMSNVATAARLSPLPQPPGPVENDATSWEFSEQPRLTLTMYHEAMATRDTWISPEDLTLWMHSQLGD